MRRQGITQLEILSGWKEIANYLGMGVRTVQRYERDLRLPIRRPSGSSRGSVIATKAELDAWVNASPLREAFRLSLHAVDSAETVKELKQHVTELHRLRKESAQLRYEMSASRKELEAAIQLLGESLALETGDSQLFSSRRAADAQLDPKRKVN